MASFYFIFRDRIGRIPCEAFVAGEDTRSFDRAGAFAALLQRLCSDDRSLLWTEAAAQRQNAAIGEFCAALCAGLDGRGGRRHMDRANRDRRYIS